MPVLVNPGIFGGGGGAGATLTFGSHYSKPASAALAIISEAGGVAGNLAVVQGWSKGSAGNLPASLSGWTTICDLNLTDASADYAFGAWARLLDGTETSQNFFTDTTPTTALLDVMLFSGAPSAPLGGSLIERLTTGNPASGIITASANSGPVAVIAAGGADGSAVSLTFSPAETAAYSTNDGNLHLRTKYRIYNSSPSNTTIDMGIEGSVNCLVGFYIYF